MGTNFGGKGMGMKWTEWIRGWFRNQTKSLGGLGVGLRSALGGIAAGGWASDHREETAHNTGFNYIAIHAIASQIARATVTVFADGDLSARRQSRRKSLAQQVGSFTRWKSIYGAADRETDPLPATHPLVRLLKRPNPFESGAGFRYRQAQQLRLTGSCLVWNVPSISGPTCERYVIPTAMASPVAPTNDLPCGGWRINPVASRYTPLVDAGYVDCPSWYRILGQIVDARQVQVIRLPHAWYLDDGQSPLSAGAKWVDAGEAVDEARYHQLRNGIDPSLVWNLPPDVSPDQDEIDRVQAKISAKYGGPQNVGRVMVAQSGTTITPLSVSPKEMCYAEGFQDFKSAVLALHQTPPVAVGLQEPGAYAAYYASMKAWRHSAIQPLCDMLAESDTEHLAPQFGTGLTVEMESETIDDTELLERQLENDLAAHVRTRNEWRAVRGMPPLPGSQGDELVGTPSSSSASSSPANNSSPNSSSAEDHPAAESPVGHSPPAMSKPSSVGLPDASRTQQGLDPQTRAKLVEKPDAAKSLPSRIDPWLTGSVVKAESPPPASSPAESFTARAREIDGGSDTDLTDQIHRANLIVELFYGLYRDSLNHNLPNHKSGWRSDDRFEGSQTKTFDPDLHPRDERGKFTEKEIHEAYQFVSRILHEENTRVDPSQVMHHLEKIPTPKLVKLHAEHGVTPAPQVRNHLMSSVLARVCEFPPSDEVLRNRPGRRSKKVTVYLQDPDKVNERVPPPTRKGPRRPLTPEQWGQLVGAQPGAKVHVFPKGYAGVVVYVDHPDYLARRTLNSSAVIQHDYLVVKPGAQQRGTAARIIAEQAQMAPKLGYRFLATGAAGQGPGVPVPESDWSMQGLADPGGYYAWARLGFTGDIRPLMKARAQHESIEMRQLAADFRQKFPGVKYVQELMRTKAGCEWWRNFGGYFDARFDLSPEKDSQKILAKYLAEKKQRSRGKSRVAAVWGTEAMQELVTDVFATAARPTLKATAGKLDQSHQLWWHDRHLLVEYPDPLTAEDEQILDEIWEELAQENAIGIPAQAKGETKAAAEQGGSNDLAAAVDHHTTPVDEPPA